jgi:hypothetical protein
MEGVARGASAEWESNGRRKERRFPHRPSAKPKKAVEKRGDCRSRQRLTLLVISGWRSGDGYKNTSRYKNGDGGKSSLIPTSHDIWTIVETPLAHARGYR